MFTFIRALIDRLKSLFLTHGMVELEAEQFTIQQSSDIIGSLKSSNE